MTRAEILNCLTDRPCDVCKFHESGRCERWDCVFEERAEEQEDDALGMTKEELAHFINATKDKWHFTTESGKEVSAEQIIKTLSKEPCEDCISRQAVLNGIDNYIEKAQSTGAKDDFISFEELVVKALPSVTPKQKMGHWIHFAWSDDCSECGWSTGKYESPTKFCPNCGAKMQEVDE